jgi:hypothetical protein
LLSALSEKDDLILLSDNSSAEETDFEALCDILDQQNILDNRVSKECFKIEDPYSFVAGAKNNPDILSCSQMMTAKNQDMFLNT